jgi:hypothetical protein
MTIEQQDQWLLFGAQCYFSLLQLSALVVLGWASHRARKHLFINE